MAEGQMPGVQHLAWGQLAHRRGRIQLVAQQGMAQMGQMHADLMGTPGMDAHGQQGNLLIRRIPEPFPGGMRGLAAARVGAFPLFRRQAADQGQIFLVHLAPGKSRAQRQARGFGQGHQQKAAGILVQTVDNAGAQAFQSAQLRKASQQALHQGVFRAGRAGVHGESGGLVADH